VPQRGIPSRDTSSESAIRWAKGWLDQCIGQHLRCKDEAQWALPTPVIDVTPLNDRGDVKLVDRANRMLTERYIALSHCWGRKTIECRTTRQTIEARKKCISFEGLPKSFRDAVTFTRGLGVRYLWIDSICIIQEDKKDLRNESSLMSHVYGNSFATLAAVHAKDCSGGLYSKSGPTFETLRLPSCNIEG
jgi:hypothetical protein